MTAVRKNTFYGKRTHSILTPIFCYKTSALGSVTAGRDRQREREREGERVCVCVCEGEREHILIKKTHSTHSMVR